MCNRRCYDAPAAAFSILIGVAFAILSLVDLLVTLPTIAILVIAIAVLILLLLTLSASSLLRQNNCYDDCIGNRGLLLLIPALLLLIVGVIALVFADVGAVVTAIFIFLIFTLLTLTLFSLFRLLSCLITAGDNNEQ